MLKVAALTSGKNLPSARFRVRQHIETLKSYQIHVDEYVPITGKGRKISSSPNSGNPRNSSALYLAWRAVKTVSRLPGVLGSWTHQVTWLQRELIPGSYSLERFLKRPIVYDVDDAIWTLNARGEPVNRAIAQRSDVVIAGNRFLAEWYSQYAADVRIIPTAVNTDRFVPLKPKSDERFIIGWTGTHYNLPYIEAIEPALKRFLDRYPAALVRVICDRKPNFCHLDSHQIEYIPWSPEIEVSGVQSMSIGLMPLEDTLWTRGKCSFKMIQYMSCEIPAIVSPVGMNNEILQMGKVGMAAQTQDDWYDAVEYYFMNREMMMNDGRLGRQITLENFSQQIITKKIATLFKELV